MLNVKWMVFTCFNQCSWPTTQSCSSLNKSGAFNRTAKFYIQLSDSGSILHNLPDRNRGRKTRRTAMKVTMRKAAKKRQRRKRRRRKRRSQGRRKKRRRKKSPRRTKKRRRKTKRKTKIVTRKRAAKERAHLRREFEARRKWKSEWLCVALHISSSKFQTHGNTTVGITCRASPQPLCLGPFHDHRWGLTISFHGTTHNNLWCWSSCSTDFSTMTSSKRICRGCFVRLQRCPANARSASLVCCCSQGLWGYVPNMKRHWKRQRDLIFLMSYQTPMTMRYLNRSTDYKHMKAIQFISLHTSIVQSPWPKQFFKPGAPAQSETVATRFAGWGWIWHLGDLNSSR